MRESGCEHPGSIGIPSARLPSKDGVTGREKDAVTGRLSAAVDGRLMITFSARQVLLLLGVQPPAVFAEELWRAELFVLLLLGQSDCGGACDKNNRPQLRQVCG